MDLTLSNESGVDQTQGWLLIWSQSTLPVPAISQLTARSLTMRCPTFTLKVGDLASGQNQRRRRLHRLRLQQRTPRDPAIPTTPPLHRGTDTGTNPIRHRVRHQTWVTTIPIPTPTPTPTRPRPQRHHHLRHRRPPRDLTPTVCQTVDMLELILSLQRIVNDKG